MKGFEEQRPPLWARRALGWGAILLFAGALLGGLLLGEALVVVMFLLALGAILYAVRGYLNTGDKVAAGALIFVALVVIGIEAVVYFLGP